MGCDNKFFTFYFLLFTLYFLLALDSISQCDTSLIYLDYLVAL